MVADDPDQKIKLKVFHAEIINDREALQMEEKNYRPIPEIKKVTQQEVMDNYFQIKMDVKNLIKIEIERLKKEMIQKNVKKSKH